MMAAPNERTPLHGNERRPIPREQGLAQQLADVRQNVEMHLQDVSQSVAVLFEIVHHLLAPERPGLWLVNRKPEEFDKRFDTESMETPIEVKDNRVKAEMFGLAPSIFISDWDTIKTVLRQMRCVFYFTREKRRFKFQDRSEPPWSAALLGLSEHEVVFYRIILNCSETLYRRSPDYHADDDEASVSEAIATPRPAPLLQRSVLFRGRVADDAKSDDDASSVD
jgi:hypothetical protein